MRMYILVVSAIGFSVDLLLLIGTGRVCGNASGKCRLLAAAAISGIHSGLCLMPGADFLGNTLWRSVCLVAVCLCAYGINWRAARTGCFYAVLKIAIGGLAVRFGGSIWSTLLAGICLFVLFAVGYTRKNTNRLIPVELYYAGQTVRLTALFDTGNRLRDPITGQSVLVVDANVAQQLTGLSAIQLRKPVETIGVFPGLRLIPYRTVGTDNGLMLAMTLDKVRIGSWQGSTVVAFAPVVLNQEGSYQGLTGGNA